MVVILDFKNLFLKYSYFYNKQHNLKNKIYFDEIKRKENVTYQKVKYEGDNFKKTYCFKSKCDDKIICNNLIQLKILRMLLKNMNIFEKFFFFQFEVEDKKILINLFNELNKSSNLENFNFENSNILNSFLKILKNNDMIDIAFDFLKNSTNTLNEIINPYLIQSFDQFNIYYCHNIEQIYFSSLFIQEIYKKRTKEGKSFFICLDMEREVWAKQKQKKINSIHELIIERNKNDKNTISLLGIYCEGEIFVMNLFRCKERFGFLPKVFYELLENKNIIKLVYSSAERVSLKQSESIEIENELDLQNLGKLYFDRAFIKLDEFGKRLEHNEKKLKKKHNEVSYDNPGLEEIIYNAKDVQITVQYLFDLLKGERHLKKSNYENTEKLDNWFKNINFTLNSGIYSKIFNTDRVKAKKRLLSLKNHFQ